VQGLNTCLSLNFMVELLADYVTTKTGQIGIHACMKERKKNDVIYAKIEDFFSTKSKIF